MPYQSYSPNAYAPFVNVGPPLQGVDPITEMYNRESANAMQNAQAMRIARIRGQGQTSTPSLQDTGGEGSPLTQAISKAKALTLSSVLGDEGDNSSDFAGLTSQQKEQIKSLQRDPSVKLSDFEGLISRVQQAHQQKQVDAQRAAKQAAMEAPFTGTPARPESSIMIQNQTMDPKQFAQGVQQARQQDPMLISVDPSIVGKTIPAQAAGPSPRQALLASVKDKVAPEDLPSLTAAADDRGISETTFAQMIKQAANRGTSEARSSSRYAEKLAQAGIKSQVAVMVSRQKELNAKYHLAQGILSPAAEYLIPGEYKQDRAEYDDLTTKIQAKRAESQTQYLKTATNPQTGEKMGLTADGTLEKI